MLEPKFIDELISRISAGMPSGMKEIKADMEKNIRAAVRATLDKMDVVTREEFDIQREVLARTRTRLEQLEKQVIELETHLNK